VRVEEKKVVVALPSRKEIVLDLSRAASFDVARPRQIEISPGDKILIRANNKQLGLTNGQVLTISGIAPDGALQTKEGLKTPSTEPLRQRVRDTILRFKPRNGIVREAEAGRAVKAVCYLD
jgi:hypothetical protein